MTLVFLDDGRSAAARIGTVVFLAESVAVAVPARPGPTFAIRFAPAGAERGPPSLPRPAITPERNDCL
ncbi:MAG: hypothetical protein ACT4P2_16940 [Pseudomonadota bacterium]